MINGPFTHSKILHKTIDATTPVDKCLNKNICSGSSHNGACSFAAAIFLPAESIASGDSVSTGSPADEKELWGVRPNRPVGMLCETNQVTIG